MIDWTMAAPSTSSSHAAGSTSMRRLTTVASELTPLSVRLLRLHLRRDSARLR